MRDVRLGLLDVVMVYKLDRISRSVKDFSDTYEEMHSHDVAFLSVKETFDTSTPIGRTVMYILAAFAQRKEKIPPNVYPTAWLRSARPVNGPAAACLRE